MADAVIDRAARIDAFLENAGWGDAARTPLPGDASFRRYVRLKRGSGRAMLMDAPPPEVVAPFVALADHLCEMGYSAPRVFAADPAAGLVLLEDLGDDTFTAVLARGGDEDTLYALATDLLIDLHARPAAAALPDWIAPYDDEAYLREAALLVEWTLPALRGAVLSDADRDAYLGLWRDVLDIARAVPETLVLRDYHVDNLMRLEGRDGVAACGLLDFQDALAGPVTYDFISLVEDARRDVPDDLAAAMRRRYLDAFPALDRAWFDASAAVLAAQRHAKVIGIFTRLRDRDGKDVYLKHIPRVWRMLDRALRHDALADLRRWFDDAVPAGDRRVPPPRNAS